MALDSDDHKVTEPDKFDHRRPLVDNKGTLPPGAFLHRDCVLLQSKEDIDHPCGIHGLRHVHIHARANKGKDRLDLGCHMGWVDRL